MKGSHCVNDFTAIGLHTLKSWQLQLTPDSCQVASLHRLGSPQLTTLYSRRHVQRVHGRDNHRQAGARHLPRGRGGRGGGVGFERQKQFPEVIF